MIPPVLRLFDKILWEKEEICAHPLRNLLPTTKSQWIPRHFKRIIPTDYVIGLLNL
jgi:hypothetical protein